MSSKPSPAETRSFSALSSDVRLRILRALATQAKTVAGLSKELGVHGVTVRYHMGLLMAQGLVESGVGSGARARKKGRPAILYRLSNRAVVPGYPERHFDLLARLSLATLVDAVGQEAASANLRGRGSRVGLSMIQEAGAKARIERWTPDAFEQVVLKGLFPNFGIACEVVSREPDGLTYRSFTCPFLEIATEVPALVCDALDDGFHAGIDEALGGARTERIACMGHGEAHCEYRVSWTRRPRAPANRGAGRRRSAGSPRGGSRVRPGAKVGSRFPDGQRKPRRSP